MARGSGWSSAHNRNAKARRSRYARTRSALASVKTLRGTVNGSRRYRESYELPF